MTREQFTSRTEQETAAIGRVLAARLPADVTVVLTGDLGAGKTTLVRAIAEALGADPLEVSSPSFALVHEYPIAGGPPVVHVDGYRLSEVRHEWEQIGVPELLRGPGRKFIEWPHASIETEARRLVRIRISIDEGDVRRIEVEGL